MIRDEILQFGMLCANSYHIGLFGLLTNRGARAL